VGTRTEDLPKGAWRRALDEITLAYRGDVVSVEIVSRQLGDQVEIAALPLAYVEYDHKDDVVIVAVHDSEGDDVVLRHIVEHPQHVRVHPPLPEATEALDVVGGDGTETFVVLRAQP
jgi:hypothetical protein